LKNKLLALVFLLASCAPVGEGIPEGTLFEDTGNDASERQGVDVPYFFQYSNELYPRVTHHNTSIAMVLKYVGWDGIPDDITREWGIDFTKDPDNLGYVFNAISTDHFLLAALDTTTEGTLSQFRNNVQRGSVIVVHGYFTAHGHVLVVTGLDENGDYIVNDPAGMWSEQFRGGHFYDSVSDDSDGHGIVYDKEQFEAAISTSDGAGPMPMWYHILRQF